jgi:hypothetical protein
VVAFHEWWRMLNDAWAARSLKARIAALFGAP